MNLTTYMVYSQSKGSPWTLELSTRDPKEVRDTVRDLKATGLKTKVWKTSKSAKAVAA